MGKQQTKIDHGSRMLFPKFFAAFTDDLVNICIIGTASNRAVSRVQAFSTYPCDRAFATPITNGGGHIDVECKKVPRFQ
jgi:hypothetical protein